MQAGEGSYLEVGEQSGLLLLLSAAASSPCHALHLFITPPLFIPFLFFFFIFFSATCRNTVQRSTLPVMLQVISRYRQGLHPPRHAAPNVCSTAASWWVSQPEAWTAVQQIWTLMASTSGIPTGITITHDTHH